MDTLLEVCFDRWQPNSALPLYLPQIELVHKNKRYAPFPDKPLIVNYSYIQVSDVLTYLSGITSAHTCLQDPPPLTIFTELCPSWTPNNVTLDLHGGIQRITTRFVGHCSSYLCGYNSIAKSMNPRSAESPLPLITLSPSRLRLPSVIQAPLILIATGSGIAPFRGFFWELLSKRHAVPAPLTPEGGIAPSMHDPSSRIKAGLPPTVALFYGCTHPDSDFLYRNEIEEFQQPKEALTTDSSNQITIEPPIITHFFGAFSRLNPEKKTYVQDVIMGEAANFLRDLLTAQRPALPSSSPVVASSSQPFVFVCGSTRMGKGVRNALQRTIGKEGYIALAKSGRYIEEVWA